MMVTSSGSVQTSLGSLKRAANENSENTKKMRLTHKNKRDLYQSQLELAAVDLVPNALAKVQQGQMLDTEERRLLQAMFATGGSKERIEKRIRIYGIEERKLNSFVQQLEPTKVSLQLAISDLYRALRTKYILPIFDLEKEAARISSTLSTMVLDALKVYETQVNPAVSGVSEQFTSLFSKIHELSKTVYDLKNNQQFNGLEQLSSLTEVARESLTRILGKYDNKTAVQIEDDMCEQVANNVVQHLYQRTLEEVYRRNSRLEEDDALAIQGSLFDNIAMTIAAATGNKDVILDELKSAASGYEAIETYIESLRPIDRQAFREARSQAELDGRLGEFEREVLLNEYHPWYRFYDEEIEQFQQQEKDNIHSAGQEREPIGMPAGGTRARKATTQQQQQPPPPPPPIDVQPVHVQTQSQTRKMSHAEERRSNLGLETTSSAVKETMRIFSTLKNTCEPLTTAVPDSTRTLAKIGAGIASSLTSRFTVQLQATAVEKEYLSEINVPTQKPKEQPGFIRRFFNAAANGVPTKLQTPLQTATNVAKNIGTLPLTALGLITKVPWIFGKGSWQISDEKITNWSFTLDEISLAMQDELFANRFVAPADFNFQNAVTMPGYSGLAATLNKSATSVELTQLVDQLKSVTESLASSNNADANLAQQKLDIERRITQEQDRLRAGGARSELLKMRANEEDIVVWLTKNKLKRREDFLRAVRQKQVSINDVLSYPELYPIDQLPPEIATKEGLDALKNQRVMRANGWKFLATTVIALFSTALAGVTTSFMFAPSDVTLAKQRADVANLERTVTEAKKKLGETVPAYAAELRVAGVTQHYTDMARQVQQAAGTSNDPLGSAAAKDSSFTARPRPKTYTEALNAAGKFVSGIPVTGQTLSALDPLLASERIKEIEENNQLEQAILARLTPLESVINLRTKEGYTDVLDDSIRAATIGQLKPIQDTASATIQQVAASIPLFSTASAEEVIFKVSDDGKVLSGVPTKPSKVEAVLQRTYERVTDPSSNVTKFKPVLPSTDSTITKSPDALIEPGDKATNMANAAFAAMPYLLFGASKHDEELQRTRTGNGVPSEAADIKVSDFSSEHKGVATAVIQETEDQRNILRSGGNAQKDIKADKETTEEDYATARAPGTILPAPSSYTIQNGTQKDATATMRITFDEDAVMAQFGLKDSEIKRFAPTPVQKTQFLQSLVESRFKHSGFLRDEKGPSPAAAEPLPEMKLSENMLRSLINLEQQQGPDKLRETLTTILAPKGPDSGATLLEQTDYMRIYTYGTHQFGQFLEYRTLHGESILTTWTPSKEQFLYDFDLIQRKGASTDPEVLNRYIWYVMKDLELLRTNTDRFGLKNLVDYFENGLKRVETTLLNLSLIDPAKNLPAMNARIERLKSEQELLRLQARNIALEQDLKKQLAAKSAVDRQKQLDQMRGRVASQLADTFNNMMSSLWGRPSADQLLDTESIPTAPSDAVPGASAEAIRDAVKSANQLPAVSLFSKPVAELTSAEDAVRAQYEALIKQERERERALLTDLERIASGNSESASAFRYAQNALFPVTQFLVQTMYSTPAAMGSMYEEMLQIWSSSVKAFDSYKRQDFTQLTVDIDNAIGSVSRMGTEMYRALHLADFAKMIWSVSGTLFMALGKFLTSDVAEFFVKVRSWMNTTGVPNSSAPDTESVNHNSSANAFLGTVISWLSFPLRLVSAGVGVMSYGVGYAIQAGVSFYDRTQSITMTWIIAYLAWMLACALMVTGVAMFVALVWYGASAMTVASVLNSVTLSIVAQMFNMVARLIWTQATMIFTQRIVTHPRLIYYVVKGGVQLVRMVDKLLFKAPSYMLDQVIVARTKLECKLAGLDSSDPELFSKLKNRNERIMVRSMLYGASIGVRVAMHLALQSIGNGFATSALQYAAEGVASVTTGPVGDVITFSNDSWMGHVLSSMLGNSRLQMPVGGTSPGGWLWFLFGESKLLNWAGLKAGAVINPIIHTIFPSFVQGPGARFGTAYGAAFESPGTATPVFSVAGIKAAVSSVAWTAMHLKDVLSLNPLDWAWKGASSAVPWLVTTSLGQATTFSSLMAVGMYYAYTATKDAVKRSIYIDVTAANGNAFRNFFGKVFNSNLLAASISTGIWVILPAFTTLNGGLFLAKLTERPDLIPQFNTLVAVIPPTVILADRTLRWLIPFNVGGRALDFATNRLIALASRITLDPDVEATQQQQQQAQPVQRPGSPPAKRPLTYGEQKFLALRSGKK